LAQVAVERRQELEVWEVPVVTLLSSELEFLLLHAVVDTVHPHTM
jgi:hypothetical protein